MALSFDMCQKCQIISASSAASSKNTSSSTSSTSSSTCSSSLCDISTSPSYLLYRWFAYIVKEWSAARGINSSSSCFMSSSLWSLLTLHFLQQWSKSRTSLKPQNQNSSQFVIHPDQCLYCCEAERLRGLQLFFNMYATWDWRVAISILDHVPGRESIGSDEIEGDDVMTSGEDSKRVPLVPLSGARYLATGPVDIIDPTTGENGVKNVLHCTRYFLIRELERGAAVMEKCIMVSKERAKNGETRKSILFLTPSTSSSSPSPTCSSINYNLISRESLIHDVPTCTLYQPYDDTLLSGTGSGTCLLFTFATAKVPKWI